MVAGSPAGFKARGGCSGVAGLRAGEPGRRGRPLRRPRHATGLAGTLFSYLMNGSHLPEAHTIYSHALHAARQSSDPAAEAQR